MLCQSETSLKLSDHATIIVTNHILDMGVSILVYSHGVVVRSRYHAERLGETITWSGSCYGHLTRPRFLYCSGFKISHNTTSSCESRVLTSNFSTFKENQNRLESIQDGQF